MTRNPAFLFHNGRSARNAQDLAKILEEGPEHLYSDHVNRESERNDFASWARLALHEPTLAQALIEASNREETIKALREWLHPHVTHKEAQSHTHRKDFLLGFATGLIVGLLVFQVISLLV